VSRAEILVKIKDAESKAKDVVSEAEEKSKAIVATTRKESSAWSERRRME